VATVVVPDPALVVLVGPAGSGKSTLAARLFPPGEIVSSDALRAAIAGDERDQAATRPAFATLHRMLARRLASGQLTVVDATSVEGHARKALLRRARAAGVPSVAIVLDLPPRVVLARAAQRGDRAVDPLVVGHHLAVLRRAVDAGAFGREPWSLVVRLREPAELDALRIERRPVGRSRPVARVRPPRRR
jgi:protein phosphatase